VHAVVRLLKAHTEKIELASGHAAIHSDKEMGDGCRVAQGKMKSTNKPFEAIIPP